MIQIRTITTDDPLYPQECALREEVLLREVGMDMPTFQKNYPGADKDAIHFVAVFDHPSGSRVVGTALLIPAPPTAKLMQMAVDRQRQGEGIGRRLVAAVESAAFGELGLDSVYCHAQLAARGFYEGVGWAAEGPTFTEAGIPHVRMRISNTPFSPPNE